MHAKKNKLKSKPSSQVQSLRLENCFGKSGLWFETKKSCFCGHEGKFIAQFVVLGLFRFLLKKQTPLPNDYPDHFFENLTENVKTVGAEKDEFEKREESTIITYFPVSRLPRSLGKKTETFKFNRILPAHK